MVKEFSEKLKNWESYEKFKLFTPLGGAGVHALFIDRSTSTYRLNLLFDVESKSAISFALSLHRKPVRRLKKL
jgi:hypothetical protein